MLPFFYLNRLFVTFSAFPLCFLLFVAISPLLQKFSNSQDGDRAYHHVYAPTVENRDFHSPLYEEEVHNALHRLNPCLAPAALQEALFKLKNFENADLVQKNAVFKEPERHSSSILGLLCL